MSTASTAGLVEHLRTPYRRSYSGMSLGRSNLSAKQQFSRPGRGLMAHQGRRMRHGTDWLIPCAGWAESVGQGIPAQQRQLLVDCVAHPTLFNMLAYFNKI